MKDVPRRERHAKWKVSTFAVLLALCLSCAHLHGRFMHIGARLTLHSRRTHNSMPYFFRSNLFAGWIMIDVDTNGACTYRRMNSDCSLKSESARNVTQYTSIPKNTARLTVNEYDMRGYDNARCAIYQNCKPIAYERIINVRSHSTPLTYFSMRTESASKKINKAFFRWLKNINLYGIDFRRALKSW